MDTEEKWNLVPQHGTCMQLKTINSHLYFAPVWAYGNVCPDATKWVKSIIQTSDVTSEKQGNGKKDQLWPHLCEKKKIQTLHI